MKLATTMNDQEAMYFLIQPYHSLVKFKCGLLSPHFAKGASFGFCDEFLHVIQHSLRNWLYWGKTNLQGWVCPLNSIILLSLGAAFPPGGWGEEPHCSWLVV